MALEASSGPQNGEQVDWDAPLSLNSPMGVYNSSAADSPAAPAPDRRIAQDALSLAEDAAAVRHGKCEPLNPPESPILLHVSGYHIVHCLSCVHPVSGVPLTLLHDSKTLACQFSCGRGGSANSSAAPGRPAAT